MTDLLYHVRRATILEDTVLPCDPSAVLFARPVDTPDHATPRIEVWYYERASPSGQ